MGNSRTANFKYILSQLDKSKCNTKDATTDLWYVIDDVYDIEIDGINTNSSKKKGILRLWKDRRFHIFTIDNVEHYDVVKAIRFLEHLTKTFTSESFVHGGFLDESIYGQRQSMDFHEIKRVEYIKINSEYQKFINKK